MNERRKKEEIEMKARIGLHLTPRQEGEELRKQDRLRRVKGNGEETRMRGISARVVTQPMTTSLERRR